MTYSCNAEIFLPGFVFQIENPKLRKVSVLYYLVQESLPMNISEGKVDSVDCMNQILHAYLVISEIIF